MGLLGFQLRTNLARDRSRCQKGMGRSPSSLDCMMLLNSAQLFEAPSWQQRQTLNKISLPSKQGHTRDYSLAHRSMHNVPLWRLEERARGESTELHFLSSANLCQLAAVGWIIRLLAISERVLMMGQGVQEAETLRREAGELAE